MVYNMKDNKLSNKNNNILISDNEVCEILYVDKPKKHRKVLLFLIFLVMLFLGIFCYIGIKHENEKRMMQLKIEEEKQNALMLISDVREYFDSLYVMEAPKNFITDLEYNNVINKIDEIENIEVKEDFTNEVNEMKKFTELETSLKELIIDNNLISDYKDSDIDKVNSMYSDLKDEWKYCFTDDIKMISDQKKNIENTFYSLSKLFKDSKLSKVRNDVTREEYNEVMANVKKLPQQDLVKKYKKSLSKVLSKIEGREKALAYAKLQAEIKAAWVKLDTPYISQNNNKIYNACEVASLLMGLQYKGYLKNVSLKKISDDVPKTDDPHTGFFRDIYGVEPTDLPHWMAPDAIARFGREYSGNQNVKDITGTNVNGLKKELDNNNPVIIYATGNNFADPKNWIEEVPNNVHVMLLIGYNDKTNQVLIHDPWTKNGTGKVYISESRFTKIYNAIGKKAVVIG